MEPFLEQIVNFFDFKGIQTTGVYFRLFSVFSVTLCILGSALCLATQYFGDPIVCSFTTDVAVDLAKQYCWIHGSSLISSKYKELDCVTRQDQYPDPKDAPTTAYYQWIPFVLLLHSAIFAIPAKIWSSLENGLLDDLISKETRKSTLLSDGEEFRKEKETLITRFNSLLHHNDFYYAYYCMCEILNLVGLIFNFVITDKILNGKFHHYGFDVMTYLQTPAQLQGFNPMCDTFPTTVSCEFKYVAPTGGLTTANGFCILSQNIVNEKVFLFLYFWYICLFIVSGINLFYHASVWFINESRVKVLEIRLRGRFGRLQVRSALVNFYIGDWFILTRIASNTNRFFFQEFLADLIKNDQLNTRNGPKPESYELQRQPPSASSSPDIGLNHRGTPSCPSPKNDEKNRLMV
ncbi:hypothetical protein TCAL_13664 [Tigriopus californicus]|uniref:Innexin n=1 Tax=Tigriopus californicus TaxID=6832 RepID=A0A553PHV3_TIGCA|nr:innexin inx2-like [Tigriopus californicus]TRY77268.1 hypothetical protein TCAL_13664 [Tigriopus californicus]|eukprot:TCALIF_13664-PA protein Name:"Similar to Inx2 Innexin inx2 (Drosophila melanogaster)" AED:0.03 eAED:0.03 QI:0/-1/0/1/-1/1/1/0/405